MRQGFPFSNTQSRGRYYYVDIFHAPYWRTITITTALLPLCCIIILGASFYIRHLYLRNREYREKIEAQKNLVVLGTAAGTLAHEIKNPLLSIRLQTGILRKIISGKGQDEIGIIEEEVTRLSELTYRVNDYLREPEGNPRRVNASELLSDTGRRLCGRDSMGKNALQNAPVKIDPDRLRSVFENVIRNALESESPPGDISASIRRIAGPAFLFTVSDRGRGVSEEDRQRVFDPFFTRKSTGTGIGLSISRRFIEAAGGKIYMENRDGGGVTVSITVNEYAEGEKAET
jgi:two-component system sensor histidine kinase HydH